MRKAIFISALLLGSSLVSLQAQTLTNYKVVNKIHLDGDEKWDYLYSDDDAARLYVSHGNQVQIIDEVKAQVIGKVTGLNGVHGIAIAGDLNKGFITSGKDSSVTIFDTKTFAVIKKMKVTGAGPDAIIYDSFSKNVFVFNGKSNNATVINASTNEVVATIPFEGNPEFAASNGKGIVYVNIESKSMIAVINSANNTVEHLWSIAPGNEPTGLALDKENNRLISVCANKLMIVVDAENGKIITNLPTGEKTDAAAFDPTLKLAFCSNGEGTVTVVKEVGKDAFKVLGNVPTKKGAKTMTENKKTHHLYLTTADFTTPAAGEKPKVVSGSCAVWEIEAEN